MATGAARSKAPETVPLTQSSTLLKLLAVLDSGNFAHFFLADESGEENGGAWSSGGARVARPSDIAGKVGQKLSSSIQIILCILFSTRILFLPFSGRLTAPMNPEYLCIYLFFLLFV
jgi:hypothetical protein